MRRRFRQAECRKPKLSLFLAEPPAEKQVHFLPGGETMRQERLTRELPLETIVLRSVNYSIVIFCMFLYFLRHFFHYDQRGSLRRSAKSKRTCMIPIKENPSFGILIVTLVCLYSWRNIVWTGMSHGARQAHERSDCVHKPASDR